MPFNILEKEIPFSSLIGADSVRKEVKGEVKISPEIKPVNVVTVLAHTKDVRFRIEGSLCISEGTVVFNVIYQKNDVIDNLELEQPFSLNIELNKEDQNAYKQGKVNACNTKFTVNADSINVSAEVIFECEVWTRQSVTYIDDLTYDDNVCARRKSGKYLVPVTMKEEEAEVYEATYISSSLPPVNKILASNIRISDEKVDTDDNIAIYTCNILIDTLYRPDGEGLLETSQSSLPFVFKTQLSEERAGKVKVLSMLNGYKLEMEEDSDGENRVIGFSGKIKLNVEAWQELNLDTVDDIYGIDKKLTLSVNEITSDRNISFPKKRAEAREILKTGMDKGYIKGVWVQGNPEITNVYSADKKITTQGHVNVKLVYVIQGDEPVLCCLEDRLSFQSVEEDTDPSVSTVYAYARLDGINFSMASAFDFEVRALVDVYTGKIAPEKINLPSAIEETEYDKDNKPRPDILIYNSPGGESLWEIAKRYRTREEKLEKINSLARDEEIKPGKSIVIH